MKHVIDIVAEKGTGRPLAGITVTIYLTGTTTPATIYSDDGITPTANPTSTNSSGVMDFYIADGVYDVLLTGPHIGTITYSKIEFADALEASAGDSAWNAETLNLVDHLSLPTIGGPNDSFKLYGQTDISTLIPAKGVLGQNDHVLIQGKRRATTGWTNALFCHSQSDPVTPENEFGIESYYGTGIGVNNISPYTDTGHRSGFFWRRPKYGSTNTLTMFHMSADAQNDDSNEWHLRQWHDASSNDKARITIYPVLNLLGIVSVSRAANVVTVTTQYTHSFPVGASVVIAGVTDASFNGTFPVASVPTQNTFTYAQTAADASSTGGTATATDNVPGYNAGTSQINQLALYGNTFIQGAVVSQGVVQPSSPLLTTNTAGRPAFGWVRGFTGEQIWLRVNSAANSRILEFASARDGGVLYNLSFDPANGKFIGNSLSLLGSTSGSLLVKPAAIAGSNTLTLPAGTTDFSATGGTSQVVKQTSTGGAFTVAQLAASDLSNGTTGSNAVVLQTSPSLTTPAIGSGGFTLAGATSGTQTIKTAATTSGTITFPAGTTDFSATGGASKVLLQTSAGAAITVAQLAASDLSNGTTGTAGTAVVLATSPTLVTPTLGVASATSINTSAGGLQTGGVATGYTVQASHQTFTTPADATTYFFGISSSLQLITTDGALRIYLPRAGTITRADVFVRVGGTLGTTENVTYAIRKNSATDSTTATMTWSAVNQTMTWNPNLAVAAGDYIEVKIVTPTWATNPTSVYSGVTIFIQD